MRHQRAAVIIVTISLTLPALIAGAIFLMAADFSQVAQAQQAQAPAAPPAQAPESPPATMLDNREISGILGREVLSSANENMGHIIDVIVDQTGRVRAAIIDFGGFLGVGSRKIAVDWNALHFSPDKEHYRIILDLTRDQVKSAPEYQEGKPVVVLGAVAGSGHAQLATSANPER
jgi:hypothetical protein